MTNYRQTGSAGYLFSIVLVAVIGGLLFGYDTAVISGAEKGLQAFFMNAKDFTYSNFLHGFTTSSALIGCIIGSALSGVLASRMGRKKALFLAGVFFFLSAMGSYYPEFLFFPKGEPTFSLLIAFNLYRVLGGLGVGMASAICPMYIAEIAPANKRGTLVSWNQFAIIFGQLVVYFVNFLILGSHANPVIDLVDGVNQILNPEASAWTAATGWRLMFVSECVPAGLFALLILLVPETPRYLALSGQDEKALTVLSNINGESKAREILAEIKATATEKTEKLFTYGWVVIFIGIMLSVFQQAIGINAVLYFAPRIFESMGMGNPMMYTVFMGVINISFTLLAVFTVEKLGRKPLLIWGSTLMAVGALGVAFSNVIAGCPSIVPVVSILVYSAAFMFSWGPICWVLIS
ncbi:MAG: sugar porter family MFS transporter, partial [Bacteroidales bacterium]|nr:sugar porter family MFS transporter [Bacteroidales bacterium]